MKLHSANLLKEGKREIRSIGDVCDAACFVWYGCRNSKPNGICEGFVLMDGETRRHLNKILNEDDGKYIESCMNTVQRGCNTETQEGLVKEILRYIPHEEINFATAMRRGFSNIQGAVSPNLEQQCPQICTDGCNFQRFKPLRRSLDPSEE